MSTLAMEFLLVASANALVASLLVLAAWLLLRFRQHAVAHFVCVLALIKLVTPPLVRLPVVTAPRAAAPVSAEAWLDAVLAEDSEAALIAADGPDWAVLGVGAALLGACLLTLRAALRTRRFRRLLRVASPPPAWLAARTHALARRMRVQRCPDLLVVPARISPMLCVLGRRAHILLPHALLASPRPEVDALLAHELAHAIRRDHWVRSLELVATALYWWLPTIWLVRRTLRAAEERCCDERVLAAIPGGGRDYANALLTTLDLLAGAGRGMPPVACGAGAFTDMKTRLTMIMTAAPLRPMSWTLRAVLIAGAAAVLPIAPILAQDEPSQSVSREELRAVREELRKLRAELEAVRATLDAGRTDSGSGSEHKAADPERRHKALLEKALLERKDARGRFEKVPGHDGEHDAETKDMLHKHLLERALLERKDARGRFEKVEGHDGEHDAETKARFERAKVDKIRWELLDKARVERKDARGLFGKVPGHDSEHEAEIKAKVERAMVEKHRKDLLDRTRVEREDARGLFEKVPGHEHDAETKAMIERAHAEKAKADALRKRKARQQVEAGEAEGLDDFGPRGTAR